MKKYDYVPGSYKWSRYRILVDDAVAIEKGQVKNVRLLKQTAGNLTEYTVLPGGEWIGEEVRFDGDVDISKTSQGEAILALTSRGSWSGGGLWHGWVFAKPGAVIFFNRKGWRRWHIFSEDGITVSETKPGTTPVEVK